MRMIRRISAFPSLCLAQHRRNLLLLHLFRFHSLIFIVRVLSRGLLNVAVRRRTRNWQFHSLTFGEDLKSIDEHNRARQITSLFNVNNHFQIN